MRDSRTRPLSDARPLFERPEDRLHAVALCFAFVVIAAVLFGTLAYRPF
jgi:hypothetical protein